jgi:ribosomal protein L10
LHAAQFDYAECPRKKYCVRDVEKSLKTSLFACLTKTTSHPASIGSSSKIDVSKNNLAETAIKNLGKRDNNLD